MSDPEKEADNGDDRTLEVGGERIEPGRRARVEVPVARLPTGTWLALPLEVLNGAEQGPGIWLSGAIHGDEVLGVEIVRRVLKRLDPARLRGHVIAAPVVNVFGFVAGSRYLPDRRDLNRSFPGSKSGSLAARLAHLFLTEVVEHCEYGIDYHAGSDNRTNLPQVRCRYDDPETRRCAEAFAPAVIIEGKGVKGTLRRAAVKRGRTVLLFEGGEPLRFSPEAVAAGVPGTLRVLEALGMVDDAPPAERPSAVSRKTRWVRASRSGLASLEVELGQEVRKGERLAVITDLYGAEGDALKASHDELVIGHTVTPLVNQGDAVLHMASLET